MDKDKLLQNAGYGILIAALLTWLICLGYRARRTTKEMRRLANFDMLTQLPNRRLILAQLEEAVHEAKERKESLTVGYFDVDKFKRINDDLGHAAGDQVLVGVADRMRENLTDKDLLGRLGGDEFLLVLKGRCSAEEGRQFAEWLLLTMEEPLSLDGKEEKVCLSLGLTFWPEDEGASAMLVQHADMAMYEAKKVDGNALFVYPAEDV